MTFKNKNLEFEILNFNMNIKKNKQEVDDNWSSMITTDVADTSMDTEAFIAEFDATSPIIIETALDTYQFNGYQFNNFNRVLDDRTDRLNISFIK